MPVNRSLPTSADRSLAAAIPIAGLPEGECFSAGMAFPAKSTAASKGCAGCVARGMMAAPAGASERGAASGAVARTSPGTSPAVAKMPANSSGNSAPTEAEAAASGKVSAARRDALAGVDTGAGGARGEAGTARAATPGKLQADGQREGCAFSRRWGGGARQKTALHAVSGKLLPPGAGVPVFLFGGIRCFLRQLYRNPRLALAVLLPSRMDPMTAIAASGLRARMESLDLLANNIANASTGGYKADREFYSLYVAPEAAGNDAASTMPLIERPWVDHAQGALHPTGNPLDVALSGRGFFAVNGPSGPLYTRNGSFRIAADGKLTSADGYPVRNTQGAPLTLQATRPFSISSDGTVTQDGVATGQLEIVDFTSTAGLSKQGSNYFRINNPAIRPAAPSGTSVEQGQLETSNTGSAEAAVRLVSVMRQFEMLQKAVSLGTEMNKKAIEEVARV